jgi:hypothetical protein
VGGAGRGKCPVWLLLVFFVLSWLANYSSSLVPLLVVKIVELCRTRGKGESAVLFLLLRSCIFLLVPFIGWAVN